jgi:hypothetical protein
MAVPVRRLVAELERQLAACSDREERHRLRQKLKWLRADDGVFPGETDDEPNPFGSGD